MKRELLLLGLLLLSSAPCRSQELMVPVVVNSAGQNVWFAYDDNQVWSTYSGFQEYPDVSRGIPIRAMCSGWFQQIFILYADNQVWSASPAESSVLWADMTRPDRPLMRAIGIGYSGQMIAAYADGQVWGNDQHQLRRITQYERLNPLSFVDGAPDTDAPKILPNPSAGSCRVAFQLQSDGPATVQLFDASGRLVRQLLSGTFSAGDYSPIWNGKDDAGKEVPSGVYLTRIETATGVTSGRVVLAR